MSTGGTQAGIGGDCPVSEQQEQRTMTWELKRTKQCAKCPWRVDVDPNDIPNGYCRSKHAALAETIADADHPETSIGLHRVMACHETHDAHCLGWLVNQVTSGNNIAMRLRLLSCSNAAEIELVGEQHNTFADTIPAAG
jgi:hypothetical protein